MPWELALGMQSNWLARGEWEKGRTPTSTTTPHEHAARSEYRDHTLIGCYFTESGEKGPRVKRGPKVLYMHHKFIPFRTRALANTVFPDLWTEKGALEELQDAEKLRLPKLKDIWEEEADCKENYFLKSSS